MRFPAESLGLKSEDKKRQNPFPQRHSGHSPPLQERKKDRVKGRPSIAAKAGRQRREKPGGRRLVAGETWSVGDG